MFLALILTQAGHSIEEYSTRLYDVLAPARLVSSLFSDDRGIGFAIFNASLVAFGNPAQSQHRRLTLNERHGVSMACIRAVIVAPRRSFGSVDLRESSADRARVAGSNEAHRFPAIA